MTSQQPLPPPVGLVRGSNPADVNALVPYMNAVVKAEQARTQAAQEETKRSGHELVRSYGFYTVACVSLLVASRHLSGAALAWSIVGIFAALTAREVLSDVLRK